MTRCFIFHLDLVANCNCNYIWRLVATGGDRNIKIFFKKLELESESEFGLVESLLSQPSLLT